MPYKIKVSENLSRDKILGNTHKNFEDIISHSKSIDLRNNSKITDLQNGYGEMILIDSQKFFNVNQALYP